MPEGTATLTQAGRPRIAVDGQDVPEVVEAALEVVVDHQLPHPAVASLRLLDAGSSDGSTGALWSDRAVFDFGRSLSVTLEDGDEPTLVFAGRIVGLQTRHPEGGAPEFVAHAVDALWTLARAPRTRTFESMTGVDVASQIAAEYGLQLEAELTGTAPYHDVLAQIARTDFDFLLEQARGLGADLFVREGKLHLREKVLAATSPPTLTWGQSLLSFSAEANLSSQRTSVTVAGWDVAGKAPLERTSSSSTSGAPAGLESGASALATSFGQLTEVIVDGSPRSHEEAQARADAALADVLRDFVRGEGWCDADGRLRAADRVEVEGVGELFSGAYRLLGVRHVFDRARGTRTQFRVERADPGPVGAGKGGRGPWPGRLHPEKVPPLGRPPSKGKRDRDRDDSGCEENGKGGER